MRKKVMLTSLMLSFLMVFLFGCIPNDHQVSFDTMGGSVVGSVSVADNDMITSPLTLRDGYTFDGWFIDAEYTSEFDFEMSIYEDMTLYAKWVINSYTLQYLDEDETVLYTADFVYGADLSSVSVTNPTKVGYQFVEWDIILPSTMPADDVTLRAVYQINQYTLTFNSDGGTAITAITEDYMSTITAPTPPIKEGYTFDGWYSDIALTAPYVFNTMPDNDVTLYAKWSINLFTITFEPNGGSVVNPITQDYHTALTEPSVPTKEGYTFGGWYKDSTFTIAFVFTTMPAENATLYAKWNINSYTLQYIDYDGTVLYTGDYEYGADLSAVSAPTATRDGYTFTQWDGTLLATMPANNLTLQAEYEINQYTIDFESNGGSVVSAITEDYLTVVDEPDEPTKVGYSFAGWYTDEPLTSPYTFVTMPADDITLYAKWDILQFTISFESNDGSVVAAITEDYLTVITAPDDPERYGYDFSGWYVDELLTISYTFDTMPADDISLYAKWVLHPFEIDYRLLTQDVDFQTGLILHDGETVVKVEAGDYHSGLITSEGRLFTWGQNHVGQVGNGTMDPVYYPTDITSLFGLQAGETIDSISFGTMTSIALTTNGRVFTWGWNGDGRLADGTTIDSSTPIDITSMFTLTAGETVVRVLMEGNNGAAITSNHRLFVWGQNNLGILGDGTDLALLVPTEVIDNIALLENEWIVDVSLGGYHSVVLTNTGRIFTSGFNHLGQRGNGTNDSSLIFGEITSFFGFSGTEYIIDVTSGDHFTGALTNEGRLFTWGNNSNGQLGDGTTTNSNLPIDITANLNLGVSETIVFFQLGLFEGSVITSEGRVLTWGLNDYGQLGNGLTVDSSLPVDITNQFNFEELEKNTHLSIGAQHIISITSEYHLYVWGSNQYFELGNGESDPSLVPFHKVYGSFGSSQKDYFVYEADIDPFAPELTGYTLDGWYTDMELTVPYVIDTMPQADLVLYGRWIINEYKIDYYTWEQEIIPELSIPLNEGEMIVSIAAGGYHNGALTSEGRLFMWGSNNACQAGVSGYENQLSPVDITANFTLSPGEYLVSIEFGLYHSSAITSDGRLFMWGYNVHGELGDGSGLTEQCTPIDITSELGLEPGEKIVMTALGNYQTAALTNLGRLFTWGSNSYGQLADGSEYDRDVPVEVTSFFGLETDEHIRLVYYGSLHGIVLTTHDRIFTWGYNASGQLGDGVFSTYQDTPVDITSQFALTGEEYIYKVDAAGNQTAALSSTGRMFTWGFNNSGQLGDGTTLDRNTPVDITDNFNLLSGEVIINISLGGYHSSAISSSNRIFGWGRNPDGRIGDGTVTDQWAPVDVTSNFYIMRTDQINSLVLGMNSTVGLSKDGRVFVVGYNDRGQLGNGTTNQVVSYNYKLMSSIFALYKSEIADYEPERTSYTLNGWYLDPDLLVLLDFNTMQAGDLSLYGEWTPEP